MQVICIKAGTCERGVGVATGGCGFAPIRGRG